MKRDVAPRVRPSLTARVIAATRAMASRPTVSTGDSDGEDRLVRSLRVPRVLRLPGMADYMAARTKFFDELLLGACRSGVRQVVIVGAGYDARSLRFRQPGVEFFEVDHPATQADKVARLSDLGVGIEDVHFVPVDLEYTSVADALATAGHNNLSATHFMCEGLTPYLPMTVLVHLLRSLASRARPGTSIAIDFIEPGRERGTMSRMNLRLMRCCTAVMREPMVTLMSRPDVEHVLRETGWTNVETSTPARSVPAIFAVAIRGK